MYVSLLMYMSLLIKYAHKARCVSNSVMADFCVSLPERLELANPRLLQGCALSTFH